MTRPITSGVTGAGNWKRSLFAMVSEVLFSSSFTALLLPLMTAKPLVEWSARPVTTTPFTRFRLEPSCQQCSDRDPARRGSPDIGRLEMAGGRQPDRGRASGVAFAAVTPGSGALASTSPIEVPIEASAPAISLAASCDTRARLPPTQSPIDRRLPPFAQAAFSKRSTSSCDNSRRPHKVMQTGRLSNPDRNRPEQKRFAPFSFGKQAEPANPRGPPRLQLESLLSG